MSSIPSPRATSPAPQIAPETWTSDPEEHRRLLAEAIQQLRAAVAALDVAAVFPGGAIFGGADNFTLNTTPSKLINYPQGGQYNTEDTIVDLAAGEVTIPEDGVYDLTAFVIGEQGNSNKEEDIFLELDVTGGGQPSARGIISVYHVATDKSDWRSLTASGTRFLFEDQVLALYMRASAGLGTFTVDTTTLEARQVAPAAALQTL